MNNHVIAMDDDPTILYNNNVAVHKLFSRVFNFTKH